MSDYIKTKEYKFPDGKTVTAYFDEYGIAKITIQALDAIFDNFINSADRVKVVRCKDCIHNDIKSWNQGKRDYPRCRFTDLVRSNLFYCSFGEKRDD